MDEYEFQRYMASMCLDVCAKLYQFAVVMGVYTQEEAYAHLMDWTNAWGLDVQVFDTFEGIEQLERFANEGDEGDEVVS